jgi:RecJ-like exonuclease
MPKSYKYQLISPINLPNFYTSNSLDDAATYYFKKIDDNKIVKKFKIRNIDLNKDIEFYGIDTNLKGGYLLTDKLFLNQLEDMADNVLSSVVNLKELIAKKKQTNEPLLFMLSDKLDNIADKLEAISEQRTFPEEDEQFPEKVTLEKKEGFCNIL